MYEHDERIVMTLDAGGTNFVFSAIQGCREIVEPICLPALPYPSISYFPCKYTLVPLRPVYVGVTGNPAA